MKSYKVSFILNLVIFCLVLFATVAMIMEFEFLGKGMILSTNRVEAFKYFTVDSNIFAGVISLIFAVFDFLVIKNKRVDVPPKIYILKYMSVVSVIVTFLVTLLFLVPSNSFNFLLFYTSSNFLFHLVIPILCLASFVCFERTNCINFIISFTSLIPVFLYSIFYTYISLSHASYGSVPLEYDWYGFLRGGVNNAFFVLPIMYLTTYLVGFIVWKINSFQTSGGEIES